MSLGHTLKTHLIPYLQQKKGGKQHVYEHKQLMQITCFLVIVVMLYIICFFFCFGAVPGPFSFGSESLRWRGYHSPMLVQVHLPNMKVCTKHSLKVVAYKYFFWNDNLPQSIPSCIILITCFLGSFSRLQPS